MTDPTEKARMQRTVVWHQAAVGDFTGALETAQTIADESERAAALATITLYQADRCGVAAVQDHLSEVHDPLTLLEIARTVAEQQATDGDVEGAQETLRSLGALRKDLPNDRDVSEAAFEDVAGLQMQLGDAEGASQTVQEIPDADRRDRLYQSFSARQRIIGDTEGAQSFAESITDPIRRKKALHALSPSGAPSGSHAPSGKDDKSSERRW